MPIHKNPAEHCRSIGIGVGDKIKTQIGNEVLVTYIGNDYVHGETAKGQPWTAKIYHDITDYTKVEPKPKVTIEPESPRKTGFRIQIDGITRFVVYSTADGRGLIGNEESRRLRPARVRRGTRANGA